jgi:hypothetical protein
VFLFFLLRVNDRQVLPSAGKGARHGPVHVDLYKLLPTPGTADADATVGACQVSCRLSHAAKGCLFAATYAVTTALRSG